MTPNMSTLHVLQSPCTIPHMATDGVDIIFCALLFCTMGPT